MTIKTTTLALRYGVIFRKMRGYVLTIQNGSSVLNVAATGGFMVRFGYAP